MSIYAWLPNRFLPRCFAPTPAGRTSLPARLLKYIAMLQLAKDNPAFDLAMEALSLLTKGPTVAPLDLVCADLGLASFSELRPAFNEIDRHGINVNLWKDSHGRRLAAISPRDWRRAQELGEQYVNRLELAQ